MLRLPAWNIFSPDAYGGNILRNPLKHFLRQHSNQQSCNHSRHHQRRSIIIQQSHRMRCRNRHQQLTDVMGNATSHTYTQLPESNLIFHKNHHNQTKGRPRQAIHNTGAASKHKTDNKNSHNGNQRRFFPRIPLQHKKRARFASPSFIPGIPAKNGINDSTYPKIMAMAANSPRYAVFF